VPNPGRLPGPILEEWDWQRTGACRDADPDLFFPPDSERGPRRAAREAAAKAVCRRCPGAAAAGGACPGHAGALRHLGRDVRGGPGTAPAVARRLR
jgi:WhiB family redox-sensing transcriptional regulator